MIGFIKWLIIQYNTYQLEQAMQASKENSDAQMMNNYLRCLEAGFTPEQISAMANFIVGSSK